MFALSPRRLAFTAALAAVLPLMHLAGDVDKPAKSVTLQGKVLPLAGVVEKYGVHLDADAAPQWFALVTDGGKIYPLVKDDSSRMFFKDAQLLNRPMRLTGRLVPGSELLQVLEVHSIKNGEVCEVFYWCEVCSIKRFEKNQCDCCGGPMLLREDPVAK